MKDGILLREAVVTLSAVVYWAGVLLNAYRVRRSIGRSPNLRPSNPKEWILWAGWFFVIIGWIGQPLMIAKVAASRPFMFIQPLYNHPVMTAGILLILLGYGGTLWCYRSLGDSWRIGINRKEKNVLVTDGPYGYVRHPIYLFQMVMLSGVVLLLPTVFSLMILLIHMICSYVKALDEEGFLKGVYGSAYLDYIKMTGRFLPISGRGASVRQGRDGI